MEATWEELLAAPPSRAHLQELVRSVRSPRVRRRLILLLEKLNGKEIG